MRVTDPDGVEWEVSREWLRVPRWRIGRPRLDVVDAGGLADPDPVGVGLWVLLLVLVVVVLVIGLPLLVLLASLLVAVGGLVLRVVLRRPWLVEAKSERGELAWRVRGTRASRRALHEVAAALERGERDFSPTAVDRLLPDSPFVTDEHGNVRVLR